MNDAVIVGGGLAGGAAATLLARSGRPVVLLERERAPRHKVCGEFLSVGAQRRLAGLGFDLDRLGGARIDTVRLVAGREMVAARLPFTALGITRRRLDAALLDLAADAGAEVLRSTPVRSIAGRTIATAAGDLSADVVLLASGKHDLRGAARSRRGSDADFVGFKTYWRLPAPAREALRGMVDVVLFRDGYAGLQLVEDGTANLCLNIRRRRLTALGGDWDGLLDALLAEPHLAALLGDATPLLPRPLAIASVPYGYRHRPQDGEQVYRVGDQLAVIPSFCGDGMAMALASAFEVTSAIAAEMPPGLFHTRMRRRIARQMGIAMAIQRLGRLGGVQGVMLDIFRHVPALLRLVIERTRA